MLPDLRYALRQLARSPGFTLVAVLTLALGAGANSLLFSVIHAVMLRPLPYPDPDRIAPVGLVQREHSISRMDAQAIHWAYFEWRNESRSFAELAAYRNTVAILAGAIAREVVSGAEVGEDGVEQGARLVPAALFEGGQGAFIGIADRQPLGGHRPGVVFVVTTISGLPSPFMSATATLYAPW